MVSEVNSLAEEGNCLPEAAKEGPVMADRILMDLLPRLADSSGRVATSFQLGERRFRVHRL